MEDYADALTRVLMETSSKCMEANDEGDREYMGGVKRHDLVAYDIHSRAEKRLPTLTPLHSVGARG